jgi:hypothetical protein
MALRMKWNLLRPGLSLKFNGGMKAVAQGHQRMTEANRDENRGLPGSSISRMKQLLIGVCVAGVLAFLSAVHLKKAPVRSDGTGCRYNLKNIWVNHAAFEVDHGGKYVAEVSTNDAGSAEYVEVPEAGYHHFQALFNYFNSAVSVLVCQVEIEFMKAPAFLGAFAF